MQDRGDGAPALCIISRQAGRTGGCLYHGYANGDLSRNFEREGQATVRLREMTIAHLYRRRGLVGLSTTTGSVRRKTVRRKSSGVVERQTVGGGGASFDPALDDVALMCRLPATNIKFDHRYMPAGCNARLRVGGPS